MKVSVLMPAYNASQYIETAIKSVLDQTFRDFELVVINDGSTDDTEEKILHFKDPRLRYFKNEKSSGTGAIRNQLLSLSQGEYVAWLDADDIALPKRLEKQIRFLDSHKEFAAIGTWADLIDKDDKKTGVSWKNRTKPEDIRVALFFGNQFTQSSMMLRKNMLPSPAYRSEYAPAEDHDLWIRLAEKQKLGTIRETLVQYRVLPESAVHGNTKQKAVREKIATDNLKRLGVISTEEELVLHQTNFSFSGPDRVSFLTRREKWLTKLTGLNDDRKIFDVSSFKKIAAKQWLVSCRMNSDGLKTLKQCFNSSLISSISCKDWRVILGFVFSVFNIKK